MNFPTLLLRTAIVSTASLLLSGVLATAAAESKSIIAYVANAGNNNVQILDAKNGETLNKLYTGTGPWRLTLSPDEKRLLIQNWYAETTAVVNLATHKIESVLPVRGPLVFDPSGKQVLAYSWPAAQLQSYDAKTFQPLKHRGTEDKAVYDMLFWNGKLTKGQYDPITKTGREVYENVLTSKLDDDKVLSALTHTGFSPAKLVIDPTGDFLLTANFDDSKVSILNELGDGRSISLAPGPRDIVFNKGGKQMIVIAWGQHARGSDIFTLDTDFTVRPWPKITAHEAKHIQGGFVDAEMGPDGLLYVLDRPGKRLLVINPDTLDEVRSLPVGDEPASFVLRQVTSAESNQLAEDTEGRKQLVRILTKLKQETHPFKDATFTETMTQQVTDQGKKDAKDGKDKSPKTQQVKSVVKTQLRLPDAIRQETEAGLVRLAVGGRSMAVLKDGRYSETPRQELLHVLYAIPGLSVDEIIRQLAGDVPGSPFLRNGIAVDIVNTVEEGGHKFYAIGTGKRGDIVSQLWLDAKNNLPVDLVEQYPVIRSKTPHGAGEPKFQGITETKLHYHEVEGRLFPTELTRYLDGIKVGTVKIEDIAFDQNLPPERFSLALLGGVIKPFSIVPASEKGVQTGPGLAVASQGTAHVNTPMDLHPGYNTNPPTSGPHTRYTADLGLHTLPIPPEVQVGNLINGAVLVQYACPQNCPELVKQLEGIAAKHEQVIVAPYPLMESKIALTAWQRIETLKAFDEKRISAFIEAYAEKKHPHNPEDLPETPESDATMMPPGHPPMR